MKPAHLMLIVQYCRPFHWWTKDNWGWWRKTHSSVLWEKNGSRNWRRCVRR